MPREQGSAKTSFFFPGVSLAAILLLAILCSLLPACLETRLPDGVVATVNDEPIHLRTLLALQDSRTAGLALQQQTVESLKKEYGAALGTLIIHTLASQELARRNLAVSEADVDAAIAVVEKDYEEDGGLAKYLAEQTIDHEQWRALVRSGLVMAKLEREVLQPAQPVGLGQIRDYYSSHATAFSLPELLDVCMVTARDKNPVQKYCSAFSGKEKENSKEPGLTVSCQQIDPGSLPAPWHQESDRLTAGKCSQLREQNGQWQAIALIRRHRAQVMSLAAAYPLVERKLLEAGRQEAFGQWLAESLGKSRILIAAQLRESTLALPEGPAADQSAAQEDESGDDDAHDNGRSQGDSAGSDAGRR